MFEQSSSESRQGKINKFSRNKISQMEAMFIESEETRNRNNQRQEERTREVGNNETTAINIISGSRDRMLAVPYNPNIYSDIRAQNAYKDGFYRHGNNELFANIDKLSDEQLESIGYNDNLSGVDLETIPDKIKSNDAYIKGYMSAIINNKKKL